ncbi:RNA-directed DNA polymerase-like protein [Gossypium australe]|uniref:RNA-directed DNA polymerase-like protein n=1 Tax=Gossypium australe TaxID=47621 RepID=A0A5B6X085_9ROSI|nr:RNA-directed DNA polymerase-like protein [Gossypium australe]
MERIRNDQAVPEDALKLKLFRYSLQDRARAWLNALPFMVDASVNGTLLNKSYNEAYEILERIANNNYQYPTIRVRTGRGVSGAMELDVITSLTTQEVFKKEIIKWLDAGIIYPISDSSWVSPVQCVLIKGGVIVVSNDNNKLIPTHTVMEWKVCMDYWKLSKATKKDHFPLSFINQMLDRLVGKAFYYLLDGYSGYKQIAIALTD